ncbi:MAG: hypothetical protein ABI882_18250, partial [Acidobacteriota bacterium]
MSNKTDYTEEEWQTLVTAPIAAGLVISLSDVSGPIGLAKEAFAVAKGVAESASDTSNELIKAIAESINSRTSRPEMADVLRGSPENVRQGATDLCKQASTIVAQKSPGETEAYKRWLVSLAQRTAEASKEGGFLGFGGTVISEEEKAALDAFS